MTIVADESAQSGSGDETTTTDEVKAESAGVNNNKFSTEQESDSTATTTTTYPITSSHEPDNITMPVRVEYAPPPPANSKQLGVHNTLLYNGSRFKGSQKSKGNSYEVEVVLQVSESAANQMMRCAITTKVDHSSVR